SYGDFVLIGTYGRGVWTVSNASAFLTNTSPTSLLVTDDGGNPRVTNHIVMHLDYADPTKLEIQGNDKIEYDEYYDFLSAVNIKGGTGGDFIEVQDNPAGLSVSTMETTQGTVSIGRNGALNDYLNPTFGINGPVYVDGPTNLVVDDSLGIRGPSA